MLAKTSLRRAPWYLVPANNKPYGRIAVFAILSEILGKRLSLKPRPLDPKMAKDLFDLE
jgi:AMP-polyphosphate phosphotransferase